MKNANKTTIIGNTISNIKLFKEAFLIKKFLLNKAFNWLKYNPIFSYWYYQNSFLSKKKKLKISQKEK